MPLARFIDFHEIPEDGAPPQAPLHFAVVLARARDGVVLVFNRYRRVWELPGGLVDPGESPRASATRELAEEAGCEARGLEWLGIVEVHDGRTHFGAVFHCDVDGVPATLENEEISGLARWSAAAAPQPLGATDAALLERFGVAR
jgi:8-oxo-dGTP diphosphatase